MKQTTLKLTIVFLFGVFLLSCKQATNVAGGNARLILSADPPQIGLKGTSSLTVSGADENGAPLPDGTRVSFSVDISGRVSPSAVQLLNGRATSTYFATLSAGNIKITATSGSVEASTTITVADNIEENVFVSANPSTFPTGGGTSVITAVVTDGSGNPIPQVGVRFTTTAGTMQSGGAPIESNSNGLAADTLNTSENATITATTDDGNKGQTTVVVGLDNVVCHMTVNTSTPQVGQTVFFFDTSDNPGNQIVSYHWNFGDGTSVEGQNVQHIYNSAGTFDVVHSVIDSRGNTISCDPFPIQVS